MRYVRLFDGILLVWAFSFCVGRDNPDKDPLIGGFKMSAQDRNDLIAFLESLTDEAVLHDPRFANPW